MIFMACPSRRWCAARRLYVLRVRTTVQAIARQDLRQNVHECADADRPARPPGRGFPLSARAPARFIDDLKREGMLHAVVLRSPVAHGRIRSIDASAARAMPGVHAVMTAADIGESAGRSRCGSRTCRSSRTIFSRSSPRTRCAMSASRWRWWSPRRRRMAEDALEAIAVDIEPLPALPDRHVGGGGPVAAVRSAAAATARCATRPSFGDADAAFAKAEYTRKENFRCHRLTGLPLETRGQIAEWDAGNDDSRCSARPRCCSSTAARSRRCSASPRPTST